MFAQKEALVRLLRDSDPETVRLIKDQLLSAGSEGMADLKDLASVSDPAVSSHVQEVMAGIREQNSYEEFSLLCHFFGETVDMEQATWALARAIEPEICTQKFEHKLNTWGRQFLVKISSAVSNRERVLLLADFMADELEFRGNSENYYSERNALLPRVIDTRAGLPITLTLLYMMVAARAGMWVDGINLPGHFIARHGEIFFDPFQRGRILAIRDRKDPHTARPATQNLSPSSRVTTSDPRSHACKLALCL